MRVSSLAVFGLVYSCLCFAQATACLGQDEADDGMLEMVIELLADDDKEMRSVGLEQVRTGLPGEAVTKRLAALLPDLPAAAQVSLLAALADRGDGAARDAVLALVSDGGDAAIQVAAVEALGALGSEADVEALANLLGDESEAKRQAAETSLGRLQGAGMTAAVVAQMQQATVEQRVVLIGVLTQRRALDAIDDLLAAALADEPSVRMAAMAALRELAAPEHVTAMVPAVLRAERGRERDAAEKVVMIVCARAKDAERRADPLLAAYETLDDADRRIMLSTLGRVGGTDALQLVEAAIASDDAELHSLGIRAVCNWPDASIAPRLIELVESDAHEPHRTSALRALIRIAPLRDDRSNAERLELLEKAMSMATRNAERDLVLDRARAVLAIESLRFVEPYMDKPAHAEQACFSVVSLAHDRALRDENKPEFHAALDKVMATSQDEIIVARAKRYKAGETWDGPARSDPPPKPPVAAADTPASPAGPVSDAADQPGAGPARPDSGLMGIAIFLAVIMLILVFWRVVARK